MQPKMSYYDAPKPASTTRKQMLNSLVTNVQNTSNSSTGSTSARKPQSRLIQPRSLVMNGVLNH
jgi:hypothetical protein